jgi:hypothetical protein
VGKDAGLGDMRRSAESLDQARAETATEKPDKETTATVEEKADPELLRQLEKSEQQAGASAEPESVEAVFVLAESDRAGVSAESGDSVQSLPSPEETEAMVKRVVERVRAETGNRVELLNVFRYLNSFLVSGDPKAIRLMLEQPEIGSAVANRQPGKVELATDRGSNAS